MITVDAVLLGMYTAFILGMYIICDNVLPCFQ